MKLWPFRTKAAARDEDVPPAGAAAGPAASEGAPVPQRVLSILRPEEMAALGGLPPAAIAGIAAAEGPLESSFQPNPLFLTTLQDVIATAGLDDPDLQAGAREQGEGYLYVIDLRTPEGADGNVPIEDILGGFAVKDGQLVPGSYQVCSGYRLFTRHGLVRLTPALRAAFVRGLSPVG